MKEEKSKIKYEKIKRKRKVSIFTVFLWIALIAVMSVITINGIVRTNSLEELRKITVRIDFSEYFANENVNTQNKEYHMKETYNFGVSKTNNITNKSQEFSNMAYVGKEGDIGIYECDIVSSDKYIMYHDVNDLYPFYKYNIVSEVNEISYINDEETVKVYYGEEIKENQDIYEVKITRRTDLRKVTVKIDFSEYFANEGVLKYETENSFMGNYKVYIRKNNNVVDSSVIKEMNFVRKEGSIGIYESEIPDDIEYIMYHDMLEKNGLYKYEIESITGNIELISYYQRYGSKENYERKYYGENLKDEQNEYEVKLVKRKDVRKVKIKVDFSEYFENEGTTEESRKIREMENYNIYLSKEIDEVNTYFSSVYYVENEEDIGIYEGEVTNDLKYLNYHNVDTGSYNRYKVVSEVNNIHYTSSMNDYTSIFYGESLKEDQDEYEIKLVKKEGSRKITVRVDFNEYFENEGLSGNPFYEYVKLTYMQNYYVVAVCKTKNVTEKYAEIKNMMFKGREGDIGIYEYDISSNDKYIMYHDIMLTNRNLYKYYIESETSQIENINYTDKYDNNKSYDYYGEKIKEEQDVYNVKLRKRADTRKVKVKVDFSKYFEEEALIDESAKTDFIEKYSIYIQSPKKTLAMNFVGIEGNVGVYEQDAINEFNCIIYHPIYSSSKNLSKYKVENGTNDIEYIENDENPTIFYGESIKEKQDIYEVKLNKKSGARKLTLRVDFSEYFANEGIKEEENKIDFIQKYVGYIYTPVQNRNYLKGNVKYLSNEGNIGIYEITVSEVEKDIAFLTSKYSGYNQEFSTLRENLSYFLENSTSKLESVIFEDEYYTILGYSEKIKEDKDIYEVKLKYNNEATYITKKVKWTDKEKGIATLNLGYRDNSVGVVQTSLSDCVNKIYIDKLSDDFDLSPEYCNSSSWKILDTVDYDNLLEMKWFFGGRFAKVPMDVFNEFYSVDDKTYKNVKFVYVKDTKTIYWCADISNGERDVNVNIVYNKFGKKSEEKQIDTNKEATLFDYYGYYYVNDIYNIATPSLKYVNTQEGIIKISKLVREKEKNTYYVGIFKNEEESKTDKIYEIETVEGRGDIVIEIPDYEESEEYYIYEVDKEGNKITDEKIYYNKNKMEFSCIRDSKVESDKSLISAVMSDKWSKDKNDITKWHKFLYDGNRSEYYFETEAKRTQGLGEEYYTDNVLNVHNIYQANAIISYDKIKYKVEYVAEEGGSVEGKTEYIVSEEEKVESLPDIVNDKGYKFVRFEVEENGKRIEVNPLEYVINKDTVFYVIFEAEKVMGLPNTSDINIWIYIGVFAITLIVAIIMLLIIHNKRKK